MPLYDVRSVHFPYVIKEVEKGKFVVLNREYKPLGFNKRDYVKYEDYPIISKITGLGPSTRNKLAYDGKGEGNMIYLYDDGCVPTQSKKHMDSYLEKLRILAKCKIEDK